MKPHSYECALALVVLLSGCTTTTTTKSQKDSTYLTEPKRLFVLVNLHDDIKPRFAQNMEKNWRNFADKCGITVKLDFVDPSELHPTSHGAQLRNFGGDTTLSIEATRWTTTSQGQLAVSSSIAYDMKLFEEPSHNLVWRMSKNIDGSNGSKIVAAATAKLVEDKVFNGCRKQK